MVPMTNIFDGVGNSGEVSAQAAWDRVVALLQASIDGLVEHGLQFEEEDLESFSEDTIQELLRRCSPGPATPQQHTANVQHETTRPPVGSFRSAQARADLATIRYTGDHEILSELALDMLQELVVGRIVPAYWSAIVPPHDISDDDAEASEEWCLQLCASTAALRRAHSTHESLLRDLSASDAEVAMRSLASYRVSFRVTVTESWPTSCARHLHRYFRRTWRLFPRGGHVRPSTDCSIGFGGSAMRPGFTGQRLSVAGGFSGHRFSVSPAGSMGLGSEEWWWAPMPGCKPPRGPAKRVQALLDPARHRTQPASPARDRSGLLHGYGGTEGPAHPSLWPAGNYEEDADDADIAEEACDDDANIDSACAEGLRQVSTDMQFMGLCAPWRDLVMRFIVAKTAETVKERCGSEYDSVGLLNKLTAWLYSPMLRWLRVAYGLPEIAGPWPPCPPSGGIPFCGEEEAEDAWWMAARRAVLQFFDTFVEVRIREAFEMVRDFPDSAPALVDLRRCLARTGRTAPLVRALRAQLTKRLLIAGAHTRDVIKVYIKAIKAMRLVDERGLLLEAVSAPIRAYLKRRKDTVRCIITALTEDSDLKLELHASAGEATDAGGLLPEILFGGVDAEASDEGEDPDAWTPDPIDADPQLPSRQRRAQDVLSLLVGIYGSKEMFIKEYKEMLADRLLGNPSYSTEKEIQNLELLKTRFGEAALAHCEVMLQDVKDSKRINANVQIQAKKPRTPAAPTARGDSVSRGGGPFSFNFGNLFGLRTPRGGNKDAPSATLATGCRMQASGSRLSVPGGGTTAGPPLSAQRLSVGSRPATPSGQIAESTPSAVAEKPQEKPIVASAVPVPSGTHGSGNAESQQQEQEKLSVDQMHALVLSQHYWPSALSKIDHPQFKLPTLLEDALSEYGNVFPSVRAKRSVNWKRAHGLVEMTVQLKDRAVPVTVTPVHFAVLACFTEGAVDSCSAEDAADDAAADVPTPNSAQPNLQEGSEVVRLSLQDVASKLELPEALVRKRIGFWVAKGVLREVSAGVYDVQESLSTVEAAGGGHLDEDQENSPAQGGGRSSNGAHGRDAPCPEELQACANSIVGMLHNAKALPLQRIHNSLHLCMAEPPYTQNEIQLRGLLERLCHEGRLEFDGSNYALATKA